MELFNFLIKELKIILKPNYVSITDLKTGKSVADECDPPFSDGRIIIADFRRYEEFVKSLIKDLIEPNSYFFPPRYRMFIEVQHDFPTPISEVELRAVRDSAEHSNASEVYILCDGKRLF